MSRWEGERRVHLCSLFEDCMELYAVWMINLQPRRDNGGERVGLREQATSSCT